MITLNMFPLVQSGLNNLFTKVTDKVEVLGGFAVLFTNVTY